MIRRFRVGSPSAGTRLDSFLASACSDLSRSRIQKLDRRGRGPHRRRPGAERSHVVRAGEEVSVDVPEPRESALEAEDIPLSILYEDEHLIAIDKPAGLVVHPAPGHASGTLVNALLHHVRDLCGHRRRDCGPGSSTVWTATPPECCSSRRPTWPTRCSRARCGKRTLRKEYLALVAGVPRVRKGEVALAVGRDPRDRKKMKAFRPVAGEPPAGAREARTLYEIEQEWPPSG